MFQSTSTISFFRPAVRTIAYILLLSVGECLPEGRGSRRAANTPRDSGLRQGHIETLETQLTAVAEKPDRSDIPGRRHPASQDHASGKLARHLTPWSWPDPGRHPFLQLQECPHRRVVSRGIFAAIKAHLAEKGLMLRDGTIVDATIIAAPSSTKNREGQRDPEMDQTKKGNQWHFELKAHIGVDAESGLVPTVIGAAANVNDVTQAQALLHVDEKEAFGDAGYQGAAKRPEAKGKVNWNIAMRPGKRRALDPSRKLDCLRDQFETIKARIQVKVEHPFHVIKNRFGLKKARYRGLAKNTAQPMTLFGLTNLMIARQRLLELNAQGGS